jgi:hypothetical protein
MADVSDFYGPVGPVDLGDPATDPPMTVRVHPDDDPRSRSARRVIRVDDLGGVRWVQVTGPPPGTERWRTDRAVADWPVQHPLLYCTAFHHAAHRASLTAEPVGDMDVDAFRTGKATP